MSISQNRAKYARSNMTPKYYRSNVEKCSVQSDDDRNSFFKGITTPTVYF